MEKFLASFLIATAVFVAFVYGVRQSALEHGRGGSDLYFDKARKNVEFKPTDEEMVSGWPVLVEGKIITEEVDSIEMEIMYIMDPNDKNTYRITFSPPSSDFKNDLVNLKSGPNRALVKVFFNPETKFRRIYKGKVMSFHIYKQLNDTQEQPVFSRRVVFEKRWRKPRKLGFYNIRPSEFITK